MSGARLCAFLLQALLVRSVSIIVELEPGIVGAKSRRSTEQRRVVSQRALPCHLAVGRNRQFIAAKFGAQRVRFTRPYRRQIEVPRRLDIPVSAGAALLMGVRPGVMLDRHGYPAIRFDMPHRIDQIAGVLRAQFQSDLTSQRAGSQGLHGLTGSHIAEANFRDLIWRLPGACAKNRPRTRCLYGQPSARQSRDSPIGHTKVIAINLFQCRAWPLLPKGASAANDDCENRQCAFEHSNGPLRKRGSRRLPRRTIAYRNDVAVKMRVMSRGACGGQSWVGAAL